MTEVYRLDQIEDILNQIDVVSAIEEGFVSYSQGKAVIPPVGELLFDDPPGDAHIKYGYIKDDDYYVIKIASGFYQNIDLGISPSNGVMLLFSQKTGELISILLDEGHLTNIRTAAAGAVAAKHLAPAKIEKIGVFGAGIQGQLQVKYLQSVCTCKNIKVWGVNQKELERYQQTMESEGYHVETTESAAEIAETCNLIITATPSKTPLLTKDQIRKGTHITAMGADTPEKNELDPAIIQSADIVVADSIAQCTERGEIHQSFCRNLVQKDQILELGSVIASPSLGRSADDQITIADLTGVAVQDIQITKKVYEGLSSK
ncbi:MAG: ornithine cyclodeaminase family protein [Proteobacteria bacterium]|nr:ornithine cyclodeaminase family protein [Pseudomonadota bacterium]